MGVRAVAPLGKKWRAQARRYIVPFAGSTRRHKQAQFIYALDKLSLVILSLWCILTL